MRLPFSGNFRTNQAFNDPCCRASYTKFGMQGHNGIDYGLPSSTPVFAAHAGKAWSGYEAGGYGNYVFVTTGNVQTVYGHLSQVVVGYQDVAEGQLIGYSGNTGNSSGPHLHFGTRPIPANNNNGFLGYVDPLIYLKKGDDDVIKPEDVYNVRIVNSEIKGWDFNEVHSGKLDAREMGAWVGQPWSKFIQEAWAEGEAFRNARNQLASGATAKKIDEIKRIVNS